MYYFSLNLEHILHGRTNLSDWEKIRCAEEFDLKYGDDPDGFTLFMKESSFSVCDDYRSSWAFIKTELHSLERYSNFGIELPSVEPAEAETDNWFSARSTETKDLQAMERDILSACWGVPQTPEKSWRMFSIAVQSPTNPAPVGAKEMPQAVSQWYRLHFSFLLEIALCTYCEMLKINVVYFIQIFAGLCGWKLFRLTIS